MNLALAIKKARAVEAELAAQLTLAEEGGESASRSKEVSKRLDDARDLRKFVEALDQLFKTQR